MERTFKITVWYKGTSKVAWTDINKTLKTEREYEQFIEGQIINTEMFDYRIEEI